MSKRVVRLRNPSNPAKPFVRVESRTGAGGQVNWDSCHPINFPKAAVFGMSKVQNAKMEADNWMQAAFVQLSRPCPSVSGRGWQGTDTRDLLTIAGESALHLQSLFPVIPFGIR